MIRHVAMFTWAADVDDEHIDAVHSGLAKLPSVIEQIRQYRHGPDLGLSDQNFDYVVVGDFDSAEDYVTYRDHPVHQRLIADLIAGRVVERAAIQYRID